jgi:transposase InsO family protein
MMKICAIHEQSRSTYGVPRVHAVLAADGIHVGKKRVARLMKLADLEGISRRKKYKSSRDKDARPAPDLVDRKFIATAPNQLWVADITYVPTWTGFLPRRRARRVQSPHHRLGDGESSTARQSSTNDNRSPHSELTIQPVHQSGGTSTKAGELHFNGRTFLPF